MKTLLVIIILLLCGILGNTAEAMDFSTKIHSDGARTIYATGDIENGDAKKLLAHIKSHSTKPTLFVLDSDGGVIGEAMIMGRMIHTLGANTGVKNYCVSSCAMMFFAGHERYLVTGAKIGVHQMKSYNTKPDEASVQYWTSKVYEYADEVNVPKEVLHLMFKTRHENIHFLSQAEAKNARISLLKTN